jgi:hypothetical protein
MKTVFQSNYDAIHAFAQQNQYEGRNQTRSVFFYDNRIYSYGRHYLLGEFIDKNTIVINDKGYSNSTSKHISILIGATSHYKQYFLTRIDIDYIYSHVFNYLKPKLAKARKPQIYLSEIFSLWNSLNEFAIDRKQKTKLNRNPKFKRLLSFVDMLQDSENINALHDWQVRENQRIKKQEAKLFKDKLKKFNNYKIDFFRVGKLDYLRLSKCGQYIETSQGVKIDISEAKRYYNILSSGANMRGEKISHYITKSFDKLLTIGCHNISKKEVQRIGNLIQ